MKHYNFFLAVMAIAMTACTPKSQMDIFVDNLMGRMTLEQKIGQLNLHSVNGLVTGAKLSDDDTNVKALKAGQLGGVFGSGDVEYLRMMQEIAVSSGACIPLITGMDVIHGFQTVFPIPLALSTSWNMDLIESAARTAAKEASASGINWVFSPMVDICRDARWGRISEGGGEDPYLGGEIAKAYVRGYQGSNGGFSDHDVMVCVKHYALYGAAEAGRDYNSVFIDRQEALNGYMRPYQQAALAGAASYMSSFNEFEGVPATMNAYLMNELLRDTWGFDGFIVSDYTAVSEEVNHGIGDLQEVSARSLQAGLDMDMMADGFVGTLEKSLEEGRVSIADIDRACRRILEAKYKLGLFDNPYKYLDPSRSEKEVFTAENRAQARKVARECQVLLKNNGVLPLSKNARIAVVGPLAKDGSALAGAWATGNHNAESVTLYDGIAEVARATYAPGCWLFKDKDLEATVRYGMIRNYMPDYEGEDLHSVPQETLIAEAVAKARAADVVIACVGEVEGMSGEAASRTDISLPDAQKELLRALKGTGKPIVMVLVTGRPLSLVDEDASMDAILNVWAPGTEGGHAVADILFGDANPSAKLTTSFPRSVGQLPLYYNHKNTGRPHEEYAPFKKFVSAYLDELNGPLYPFGFGLSYTTYEYSPVSLSASEMSVNGTVTASVKITNTGVRDGDEIVQLYIHDIFASSTRPIKELRGFRKVHIAAGQSVQVDFTITAEELSFYNHQLEWVCEPGDFDLFIGPDSQRCTSVRLTVK